MEKTVERIKKRVYQKGAKDNLSLILINVGRTDYV